MMEGDIMNTELRVRRERGLQAVPFLYPRRIGMPTYPLTGTEYTMYLTVRMELQGGDASASFRVSNTEHRGVDCFKGWMDRGEEKECSAKLKMLDEYPFYLMAETRADPTPITEPLNVDFRVSYYYYAGLTDRAVPLIKYFEFFAASDNGRRESVRAQIQNIGVDGDVNVYLYDYFYGKELDSFSDHFEANEVKECTLSGVVSAVPDHGYAGWMFATWAEGVAHWYESLTWRIQTPAVSPPATPTPTPTPVTPTPVTPTPTPAVPCDTVSECLLPRVKCGVKKPRTEWGVFFPRIYCLSQLSKARRGAARARKKRIRIKR